MKKTSADETRKTKTVEEFEREPDTKTINLFKKVCQNFKAPENITVSQWADKYRRLSAENSAEAGRWKTSRTPYLKEIMDSMTDDRIDRIVVVASSQVGKTEAELNMLGYLIDQDPGPVMWCTPTLDLAEDFSKRRIAPMIRDTKCLRGKVENAKAKSGKSTILKKSFPGGMLTLVGANSPASLASVPARYIIGDELDRWPHDAGGEGDPWNLLEARTTTFYNRKLIAVSTPTTKGTSKIETEFQLGTQEHYCCKCPACGEYHFIEFDDIHFKYHKIGKNNAEEYIVDEVEYCCPSCGCLFSEQEIRKTDKKWVADNPEAIENHCRSFWINAFISPWVPWETIVRKFLEARNDPEKLKTVFNTLLGRLWEDRGELMDEDEALTRREPYDAELPDGVLCLTCGVDTQDNRLEYEVVGHGYYDETWGIEKGVIVGRPDAETTDTMQSVWERLDKVIDREWTYKDGKKLKISLTFVDSGGHFTQEVYEQCARRINKRVFAIKGKGGQDIPFTGIPSKVNIMGKDSRGREMVKGKAWLYNLGVDAGKEKIMASLKVQTAGAGFCHFPADDSRGYDINFFNGLLSEKMTYRNNKWVWEKLPGHERNEALDCRNYANAAFRVLNPNLEMIENRLKGAKKDTVKQINRPRYKSQPKRRRQESGDW
jgi:phage terminase large subunit GpA-like protein